MELDWEFMEETLPKVWAGAGVTMELTLLSLLLALPIGFYLAVIRLHGCKTLQGIVRSYVSFVRGTPIVLQILLLYSLLPSVLNVLVQAMGWQINIFEAVDPFWYAVVVFTINTVALLAEVFRSALNSIPRGQMEAGLAIGLSSLQVYLRVIIPQAMVVAMPSICNITVNLVKGTSLAFLMTVKDIMAIGKIAASFGYNYLEAYIDVFFVYLVLCTIIQIFYHLVEGRIGAFRVKRA